MTAFYNLTFKNQLWVLILNFFKNIFFQKLHCILTTKKLKTLIDTIIRKITNFTVNEDHSYVSHKKLIVGFIVLHLALFPQYTK